VTVLTTLRKRKNRGARAALGGFVVVWLSMMLQPCLMGMELSSDHDCPHCPPQTAEHPCDTARDSISEKCSFVDGYDYDGRLSSFKHSDISDQLPAIVSRLPLSALASPPKHTLWYRNHYQYSAHGPPLNLLNCTFLI